MSEFEARAKLLQFSTLVEDLNNVLDELHATAEGNPLATDFDVVAAAREKYAQLRVAYGYPRSGPLIQHRQPETPFPELDTIPAPLGWDKIEAGHEHISGTCTLPELLRNQAA